MKYNRVVLGVSTAFVLAASSVSANFKIYVSNAGSGEVTIYDQNHVYLGATSDPSASSLRGLQLGPNGHIYAAAFTPNLQVLDFGPNDTYLGSFGNIRNMQGLAVGSDGRIYASGPDLVVAGRIYSPAGVELGTFDFGSTAVVTTSTGHLVGVDGDGGFVEVMDLDGAPIRFWFTNDLPSGLAFGPDGLIYVPTRENIIEVYEESGSFVRALHPPGLYQPAGLAFSPRGTLYIANGGVGNVLELNYLTGAILSTIGDHLYTPIDVTFREDCTDADRDGYFVEYGCGTPMDCSAADPNTHPGASEVNDAFDNNCPGEYGYGMADEISDTTGFLTPGDTTAYSWPSQALAVGYEVARASDPGFLSDCTTFSAMTPSISDPAVPSPGTAYFYLVRATAPNVGSWGKDSSGADEVPSCQ